MNKNYIVFEKALKKTYFKNPMKSAITLLLIGATAGLTNAQNIRAIQNSNPEIKLSYNEQINIAALKMTGSPVIKAKPGKNVNSLGGVYTVGATGDYVTLTAAVAAFNAGAITGPVTFNLLDASYGAETFPITIEANAGSSAANTLTIKPATGVDATITGNAAVILKINGADYVTIDGSNNGTNSKNLTLASTATTGTTAVAWVASTTTDGADHVTFKNTKFLGQTPSLTIGHIVLSGPTLGGAGTIPNNYFTVEGNQFNRAQNAVFAVGLATAQDDGAVIKDNVIGSSTLSEGMGYRGLAVQNAKNVTISGNTISGVTVSSTATSVGILVGATMNNVTITGNRVDDVSNTNATGYGSAGINSNVAAGSSNVLIANNFVTNIYSRGFVGNGLADNGNGIIITGAGSGIKVYHNTVSLNTNQTATGRPAAFNVASGVPAGAVDVRNNIFVNNQTQTGERFAILSGAANTSFANVDYNNYFSTGANLGFIGSARADLAAVQAGFGGNTHSLNVAPTFVSATDLHLTNTNSALDNKGTPLADVTVDIDNQARSATTPDMGADEFKAAMNGVYTVGVAGDYETLTAAAADFNADAIGGAVTLNLIDANYPSENFPITFNANAGSSATNKLTIKPATGVDATITGNAAVILKINGADYVTIDGSNNGTNSKNLTLASTATTGTTAVAWVASTTTDGADHVTFKNTKFLGQTPSLTIGHIVLSGPTLGGAGTIPNNYFTVEGNQFNRAQNAVFAVGLATAQDDGAVIKDNVIGSSTLSEGMGYRGLAVQNAKNVTISGNTISGVTVSSTATSVGILVGATMNNVTITGNRVDDVSNTNATGYGSAGINSNVAAGSSNVLIANNFVTNIYSRGFVGNGLADNGNGIIITGAGSGIKVYHNTVSLNTNQTATGRPAAFNVASGVPAGAVDVRNNIFVNNQTQTGERFAILSGAANTSFANVDYNNYFSTGANLGFIGSARADLAAVQAGFGGNTHSLNVAPTFVSATDLHLTNTNSALDNKGTPLADVTVDIDGDARSATTPDMGADEFTATTAATSEANRNALKLYPNPVVDVVNINYSSKIDAVEIYNMVGQRVATKTWNANSGTLDMSKLAPGVYIITLKTNGEVKSVKVTKK